MTPIALDHIHQPPGSSLCGHCCVAMVLGITLEETIKRIGYVRGTKAKELALVLRIGGVACKSRRIRYTPRKALPKRALLALSRRSNRRKFHWVLLWDGWVYDPEFCAPWLLTQYLSFFDGADNADLTSYLPLEDRRGLSR
jgi:hypothetical protein